jgi:hypothetical protein
MTWLLGSVALVFAMTACPSDDTGSRGDDGPEDGCGDDVCQKTENQTTCPADCKPTNTPVCGNGMCEGNESQTCPTDCNVNKCGNNTCDVGETSTCPNDCPASLKTVNNSSYTIYSLYVAKCGSSSWGVDQTGTGYISPGTSFTLNSIPPDCYWLRAETSGAAQYWQNTSGITFQPSSLFTWTLSN